MDLDTTEKMISVIAGTLMISGTLYTVFRTKINGFVRWAFRQKRKRRERGKQCPRCHAQHPRRASRCSRCNFQFAGGKQKR